MRLQWRKWLTLCLACLLITAMLPISTLAADKVDAFYLEYYANVGGVNKYIPVNGTLSQGTYRTISLRVHDSQDPFGDGVTNYTWTSSNEEVAKVFNAGDAQPGMVTCRSEGTAVITVKAPDGRTATVRVAVFYQRPDPHYVWSMYYINEQDIFQLSSDPVDYQTGTVTYLWAADMIYGEDTENEHYAWTNDAPDVIGLEPDYHFEYQEGWYYGARITCKKPGTAHVRAQDDYGNYTEFTVIVTDAPVHRHDYHEEVIPPSCTSIWGKQLVCDCGERLWTEINFPLDHDYKLSGHQAPTATSEGYDEYTCTRCGDSYRNAIPASDCPASNFVDVPAESNWAHAGVDYVVANGLMGGTDTTHFAPDSYVDRAMLVSTLWRAAGSPQVEYKGNFSDVKAGKYYTTAVAWASELGIVRGDADGKFNPADNVTRQDLANVLYQYAIARGVDTTQRYNLGSFSDGKDVSTYAKDAMSWLLAKDMLRGADGLLNPKESATRAQFALILMNYLEGTR